MDRRRRVQTDEGSRRLPGVPMSRRELVALAPVFATALSGCAGLWGQREPGGEPTVADEATTTTYGYGGTPTAADPGGEADVSTTARPAGSSGGAGSTPRATPATTTTTTTTTSSSTAEGDYGEQGYGQYGYGGSA